MNLENCRYLDCGSLPPPLTAHKRNAVRVSPTAKNSRTVDFLHRIHSSVAFLLCAIKGKPFGMAGILPRAQEPKNSSWIAAEDLGLFSDQDR